MFPASITSEYEFQKRIGKGATGNVYLFKNKISNENIAIKEILKEDLNQDQINNIKKEIQYMSNYSKYENSIKLIKSIEDDNCIYILMEYCEMNLEKYIKNRMQEKNPLEINDIKNILIQLNNILEILFRNKIAHRDLKPNNILLKFDNKKNFIVKLSDYGNIKQITNSIMTQSNFKGTAIFKAPEILKNEKHYDPIKADLWCIGIIIYYMIKGEYPFNSDANISSDKKKLQFNINNCDTLNNLFKKLTYYDPSKRISFNDYFNHPFFKLEKNKKYKIIFLGESGCGKTSFLHKLCYNKFNENLVTSSGFGYYVKLYINIYIYYIALLLQ